MLYLILGLYLTLIFIFSLTFFFIVYHMVKYSINPFVKLMVMPIFIVISALLLFSNIILFFTVDWNKLISSIFQA